MATIEEKQIAKEILVQLIEKNHLDFDSYPNANSYLDLTRSAYKDILKTVVESE